METDKWLEQGIALVVEYAPKIVMAILIWIIGSIIFSRVVKYARKIMERRNYEISLREFLGTLLYWALKILLIIVILGTLGIETTSFAAIIASAGLAVGLALQGSLANFAGGVLILIFKPFKVGDFIEAQGLSGTVKEIGIINTVLNTFGNQQAIIPNGKLSNENIVNYSAESTRRENITAGISYDSDIKKAVSSCVKEFGGIDILVSNAGIFSSSANLESIDDKKWKQDLDINLATHHRILRECIPYLKLGIDPAIIFMGSRNVGAPGPGAGTYTIAKSGLTQMSRLAAIELSKYNIRVNTVHPDCVYDTDVWSHKILKARAKQYGLSVSEYKRRNLLKTDVSSADVAELVAFLVSTKSSKTTGAQIPIDGGNDRII